MAISGTFRQKPDRSSPVSKGGVLNWKAIPHKGMERPTDAEFKTIIEDLGKKMGEALAEGKQTKNYSKFNELKIKYTELAAQYVSKASPDRKALVEEATNFLSQFSGKSGSAKKGNGGQLTVIDYLNIKDGIGQSIKGGKIGTTKGGQLMFTLDSGTSIIFNGSCDDPGGFEIKSSNGDSAMIHHYGEWAYQKTAQEQVLAQEFHSKMDSIINKYKNQAPPAVQSDGRLDVRV